MKLKSLLAAGRSFAPLRNEKSPYALCKDNLLPAFSTQPKLRRAHPSTTAGLRQPDLLEDQEPVPKETVAAPQVTLFTSIAPPAKPTPEEPAPSRARKIGFWGFFKSLFGIRQRGSRKLIQSELELSRVKVVRNDLADSDLELVVLERNGRSPKPIYKPLHRLEQNPLIRVRTRLFEAVRR
jgi:hypothetical protein